MLLIDTKFTNIPSFLSILHVEYIVVDFGSLSYLYVLFGLSSFTDVYETFCIIH